ncbi:hypothetical protein I4F81_001177 [Pyropia yezoensis]|uniref:Uncharacterized protein n=1 Tax=Pyropia yezoensis TaxID=2788 RepID=A0ACC3BM79_PYRYE|nr:hypothetical protein I4F81_001177 [Neopyropia yezoensis]
MASMQSNGYVLAGHHLAVLHERWVPAARAVRLYLLLADRVWGGWVAAADARAAAAAAAAAATTPADGPAPPPVAATLARLAAAAAATAATWARFATTAHADALLPTLWEDLHALTAAAAAAFRRVEAALPAEVAAAAAAPGGRRGAKRRADAAAMAYARGVYGPAAAPSSGLSSSLGATAAASVAALVGVTHWVGAPEWVDRLAATHLRGGAAARAAYDAELAAWRARRAEVMAFFEATPGAPAALPRHLLPKPDPARMMFDVLPAPIGV